MLFIELLQLILSVFLIAEIAVPIIFGMKMFPTIRFLLSTRKFAEVNEKVLAAERDEEIRAKERELKKKADEGLVHLDNEQADVEIQLETKRRRKKIQKLKGDENDPSSNS